MFATPVDPVKDGFVVSFARPGGNHTGLVNPGWKLHGKQLELLKETFPQTSRVTIISSPEQQKRAMKEVEAVGQALGIQIQWVLLDNLLGLESLESTLSTISQELPDALLIASMRTTLRHLARIIDFAAKKRLPTMYARSQFVDAGGLMSYDAARQDLIRRVAAYVDKIFKGAKPADLPIEQPTKFELIINLKTAKQIGVTIPREVLFRADKVIK